jgi:cell division protein FtsL
VSPRTAAAAALRHATAIPVPGHARPRPRPAPPRRRSGAVARPRTAPEAAGFDFVGLLDRILRGPVYIALIGALLTGIVFFNVGVLQLNHGIAATDVRTNQLERENAQLTKKLASLASSERIQALAIQHGLVLPQPGDVHYLRATPNDPRQALRMMTAPDPSSATTTPPTTEVVPQSSAAAVPTANSQLVTSVTP